MSTSIDKQRDCPVMATIAVIGGKWKPRVLWQLRTRPTGFGDLHRCVGASEKMLSQTLRELEAVGVISRKVVPVGNVVTTEYAFTDYGRTLVPVLDAMGQWGLRHLRSPTQGGNPRRRSRPS
jgi:DNA-binding HxlR family transcriptional regulator